MNRINKDLIKDLIISILIVICIALVISVVFYDDISLTKFIPETEKYQLSEEMQSGLEEAQLDKSTEVITTYYIDASDLKKYEKTKEYEKGKQNPFAIESANPSSGAITDSDTDTSSSNTTSNKFYEDDGTK